MNPTTTMEPINRYDSKLDMQVEVARMLSIASTILIRSPKELTPDELQVWVWVLHDAGIKPAQVMPSFRRYARTARWFPTPADIIDVASVLRIEWLEAEVQRERLEAIQRERDAEQAERDRRERLTPAEREAEDQAARQAMEAARERYRHLIETLEHDGDQGQGPRSASELMREALEEGK